MTEKENNFVEIFRLAKEYAGLRMESLTFTVCQKLTRLMGMMALVIGGVVTSAIVIAFAGVALANYLAYFMPVFCGYLIVAGIALLVFMVIYWLRRVLILDPLARFLSRLFLDR